MTLSLNNSSPQNGHFIDDSDALWSAIGGPVFTILQGLVFLLLTWLTKSIYAYSITFFAVFSRFFSILFGGINLVEGTVISPKFIGKEIGLHPVTVLFALLVGGELFGALGVIVSIPVAGILKALYLLYRKRIQNDIT